MNTLFNKALLLSLGATLLFNTSCKKDDDSSSSSSNNTPTVASNEVTYKVNGAATTASTVTTNSVAGSLYLNALTASPSQSIYINLGAVTAVGTLANTSTTYTSGGNSWISLDLTGTSVARSTVILTDYNTTTRKMSGTFTATLVPAITPALGNKSITEGKFTNVSF